ncbi:MAG: hypothetical protein J6A59_13740 [Lachnospiraceae bacterium]|nr:hypothetical protein [Lachnospiraceae bacterium]
MSELKNIKFVKEHEDNHQIVCNEKGTGYYCVVGTLNEKYYDKDTKAVKVYYGCPDNDDGEKDFFVGEQELEDRFENFRLESL